MQTMESPQVKMVMGIIHPTELEPSIGIYELLADEFGPIDYKGPFISFADTPYYEKEFGEQLVRRWIGFQELIFPENLPDLKLRSSKLEKKLSVGKSRQYNLDPGYLDSDKLVLASFKRGPFKLYMGKGVWADMLLSYAKGKFHAFPWSFTDFCDDRYHKSLTVMREKFKASLRRNIG